MKRILVVVFCLFSMTAFAQEDWASKIQDMTPEELKTKMEELEKVKKENKSLKAQIEELKNKTAASSSSSASSSESGIRFKVQIGAFRDKNLTKYFDNNPNFSGTVDSDGTKKYTLGNFTDYWEADTFKKYLRDMGVKDAWIVSYKDGKRVPIKDVLEGVYD